MSAPIDIAATIAALCAPFPEEQISWRKGSKSKFDADKFIPLAYIDQRDVQKRLEEVMPGDDGDDCRCPLKPNIELRLIGRHCGNDRHRCGPGSFDALSCSSHRSAFRYSISSRWSAMVSSAFLVHPGPAFLTAGNWGWLKRSPTGSLCGGVEQPVSHRLKSSVDSSLILCAGGTGGGFGGGLSDLLKLFPCPPDKRHDGGNDFQVCEHGLRGLRALRPDRPDHADHGGDRPGDHFHVRAFNGEATGGQGAPGDSEEMAEDSFDYVIHGALWV